MLHSRASITPRFPVAERIESRFLLSGNLSGTATVMPTLTSGDFNGDGADETLVWVTAGRARLADLGFSGAAFRRGALLLLDGAGGLFGGPLSLRARGGTPPLVAAGDFNGDGNLDLVIGGRRVSGARRGLALLAGNGDGTFDDAVSVAGPPATVTSLVAADVNNDGKLDLVGTGRGSTITDNPSNVATGRHGRHKSDDAATRTDDDDHRDAQIQGVELATDNGSARAHRVGATAEAGGGFAQSDSVSVGDDASVPPGFTPPSTRGATEEAGGGRVGGFEGPFSNDLIGGGLDADDPIFVLLGNGDGTFTAQNAE
jgi:hypothetical protein